MKTIGLVGGITSVSTGEYYRLLNELSNKKLGGVSTATILIHSVNFGEIKRFTELNEWENIAAIIIDAATKLEIAGAECIMLGANTMHKLADDVQAAIKVPLIHVAEATAKEISKKGLKKVAFLGTKYTMQHDFYKNKLSAAGIEALMPDEAAIETINRAIYEELGRNIFTPETKNKFLSIIERLREQGAEGVVLGCTEIPLLIKQADVDIPVFDTTFIHSKYAVEFAAGI